MDGLMIESHIRPEEALTDKKQQITPGELKELLSGSGHPKGTWNHRI